MGVRGGGEAICFRFDLHVLISPSFYLVTIVFDTAMCTDRVNIGSEDKSDHTKLARKLALSTKYPVAVPNYRLSPKEPTEGNSLRHPEHAKDILSFLEFICGGNALGAAEPPVATSSNLPGLSYHPRQLFLIGHSCSAHMLCTIFLNMPPLPPGIEGLHPSAELLKRTQALVLSEGLYDIDALLESFPTYRQWFIEAAFGARDSYADFAATSATIRSECRHIRWKIIHSSGDTNVDIRQSKAILAHLSMQKAQVSTSFGQLLAEHDEILRGDDYVDIVRDHIVTGFV